MSDKIIIRNIVEKNKGTLVLQCDVELVPWNLVLKEVKYFEKGEESWIGMPSRSWKDADEWYHKDLCSFTSQETKDRFRSAVCKEIQDILKNGLPEVEPFAEGEEVPF